MKLSMTLALIMMCGLADASGVSELLTDIGPAGYMPKNDIYETVFPPSCNPDEMEKVKEILESYKFKDNIVINDVFDCSNVSEAIWYVLEKEGYNCSLVANAGKYNNTIIYHMFVWVHLEDGVLIIEPTDQRDQDNRIGLVLENVTIENDQFYLHGWMFGDPVQFIEKTGLLNEVEPTTTGTPIETLQITRVVA